ncbi:MAG: hypothetical protein FJ138_18340, partial [Deltaproteobacteria bacterium]|nr:hypothetical protein [Deltaproteobacteria bacterium]
MAVLALLNRTQELVSADEAALLADVVRNAAQRLPRRRFLVISKESVTVLLPPTTRLEDCVGECAVETGRLIGARWLVTGSVVRFGKGLRVSLALFDTREARQVSARISKGERVEDVEVALQADALELLGALDAQLLRAARALRAQQAQDAQRAQPSPAPPAPPDPPAPLQIDWPAGRAPAPEPAPEPQREPELEPALGLEPERAPEAAPDPDLDLD